MTLWSHQQEALSFAQGKEGVLMWHGMGTGKTRTAITWINLGSREILLGHPGGRRPWWIPFKRVLVVCPKAVLGVWEEQLKQWGCELPWTILDGHSVARKSRQYLEGGPGVYVVNYESAWRMDKAIFKELPDAVVLDEIHRIKSPGSKVGRFFGRLGRKVKHKLGLSGTPTPQGVLDAYGSYRFLDQSIFGWWNDKKNEWGSNYSKFRSRYALTHPQFHDMVLSYRNVEEFAEKFYSICHRVNSDDVQDLPSVQHIVRSFELSPKIARMYKQLNDDMVTWLSSGETLTADNVLVQILRLQQLASGALPEEPHEEKQYALRELLSDLDATEPVVVFARFTADLDAISNATLAAGGDRGYYELSGRRNELGEWKERGSGVLGVQIAAGSEGIDLTAARYCVYYTLDHSLARYEQSLKRCHRPGQDRKVWYYHLQAKGTIDVQILQALQSKKNIITSILGRNK